jgi:U3 small nucleolar RNA-associated protein 22
LENGSSQILNSGFLDIVHSSFNTFRLRICHDREQILLEQQMKNTELGHVAKEEAAYALAAYKKTFIQEPKHSQTIRTLCRRFPLLSSTIRLFKQWTDAHLLSSYLSEELLEIFVAQVFLCPYPWDSPSGVVTGFLRTLHLLARWDWQKEPLVVDFNGELTPQDVAGIKTRFDAWRNIDPAMNNIALFVASNLDPDGVTWTQFARPPGIVAARLSSLAKAAMKAVKENGLELNMAHLFRSPLTDYDFVLHLKSKYVTGRLGKQEAEFKNIRGQIGGSDEITGSRLVEAFLDDLNILYHQIILFFRGSESGSAVAGLWNPQAARPRNWCLKMGYSTRPVDVCKVAEGVGAEVTLNKEAILNEIAVLGGDIVEKIQVNR